MQVVAGAFERAAVGYRADRRSLFLPTFMRDERFAEDSFKGFSSTSFARFFKVTKEVPIERACDFSFAKKADSDLTQAGWKP